MTANRRWMLGNAFWRMFEHGRKNNTVSAQCEVQALDMFLDGQDMPAWKTGDPARTPLSATYTRNTPEDPKRG